MSLPGVAINLATDGLGRTAAVKDGVSGIIFWDMPPPSGLTDTQVVKINSVAELEALGITAATQTSTTTPHYHHITEFYRFAPGQDLYLMFVDDVVTMTADLALRKLQQQAGGEVRQVFWAGTYSIILGVLSAIRTENDPTTPVATSQLGMMQPVHNIVECAVGVPVPADIYRFFSRAFLQDRTALELIAGSSTLPAWLQRVSGGATMLGLMAGNAVSEDMGFVRDTDISDELHYQKVGFTNGNLLVDTTLTTLTTYFDTDRSVVARTYPNKAGVYIVKGITLALATSDYANITNVRVIHKAIRQVYAALVPYINSNLADTDAAGLLLPDTIAFFSNEAGQPLRQMQADGDINDYSVLIPATQNVQSTSTLSVKLRIQPRGYTSNINVDLGFSATL